jgi:ribosomal protein S18 acetylase RimI-like enzyme
VIEIKVLRPDDWELWRELRQAALEEAPYAFGATLADWQGDGDREQRWRLRLEIPGSLNLIAYLDGVPVGMGSGIPAEGDSEGVEVISFWVSPAARGRGVGDRLLGEIESWAAGQGARTMRLSVMPGNAAALALYARQGLRETGEKGDPTPDGTGFEVVMAKTLAG